MQAPLSVVCPSVVRPSTILNDFSSETTGPIATKFHIQPPGPLGKKSCSNDLGHMTNMAAMPICRSLNLSGILWELPWVSQGVSGGDFTLQQLIDRT